MQIIVHQWAFPGGFEQLALLPRQEFTSDWFGYDVDPPARFTFATDGQHLWFLAERAARPAAHPEAENGQFKEELWKYDVAEWFLASPESGYYWEFNLAPSGAWWAAGFLEKRKPDTRAKKPAHVETFSEMAENSWTAMAKIPLNQLPGVDLRQSSLACSFILDTPAHIFMTSALDLSGEPDFHRPEDFSAPILK